MAPNLEIHAAVVTAPVVPSSDGRMIMNSAFLFELAT